ncbi:MAG: ATP-binding cassette domain-containing protein, partial [Arthrobacter sp.]|uniref:ATP-binding cassette domain-containing protein n=1 Tax=Arthrobacter sp. TaxID=1667 RepID=UPI00347DF3FA
MTQALAAAAQPAVNDHEHLTVSGVGKSFGDVRALRDVGLGVLRGTTTAIVGPSGSGKTTLLRVIAGFDAPDEGTVRLNGRVVADGRRLVPAHKRN